MSMSIWLYSEFFKKPKMVIFLDKKNRDTDLKLGMKTELEYANNMGWVPSGHTSSSLCVKLKMPKWYFKKNKKL